MKLHSTNSHERRAPLRAGLLVCSALALSACSEGFDLDLRGFADGFSTADAANQAKIAPRPQPDANGVISYPNYQVVIAQKGDTIDAVANRLGLSPSELGRYNGIPEDVTLRDGEVIALPRRIGEADAPTTQAGTIATGERIDVTSLASEALDEVDSSAQTAPASPTITQATPSEPINGREPIRHQVTRGETAYSIARKYGISVRTLSDWNGLGADLAVQEGRYLLIPVVASQPPAAPSETPEPGAGTQTPEPPSAATPLPDPAEAAPASAPEKPAVDLGATQTSTSEMTAPVAGSIIRDFNKSKSTFVLFGASAGSTVKAAKAGTVKLISTNADGVKIMVVDHGDGLQTGYSFIDDISVKKGDTVERGQKIATVTQNEFGALQFMVFKGTRSVDPAPYLN